MYSINGPCLFLLEKVMEVYFTMLTGKDAEFVGPEMYTIFLIFFKKINTHFLMQH